MNSQSEQTIQCPYCGQNITVLVDNSIPQQTYIEDCQVCCRPIKLEIAVDHDGDTGIVATNENE